MFSWPFLYYSCENKIFPKMIHSFQFFVVDSFFFFLFRVDAAGDLRGRGAPQGETNFSLLTRFGWGAARHPLCLYPLPPFQILAPYAWNKKRKMKKWKKKWKNEKVIFFLIAKFLKFSKFSWFFVWRCSTFIHIYIYII